MVSKRPTPRPAGGLQSGTHGITCASGNSCCCCCRRRCCPLLTTTHTQWARTLPSAQQQPLTGNEYQVSLVKASGLERQLLRIAIGSVRFFNYWNLCSFPACLHHEPRVRTGAVSHTLVLFVQHGQPPSPLGSLDKENVHILCRDTTLLAPC